MILQSLVKYYEALADKGMIARPGWSQVKVSYAAEISDAGELLYIHSLKREEQRGKKTVFVPANFELPARVKKASGVSSNFLCENAEYLFGLSDGAKPKRSLSCFESAKELHLSILRDLDTPAAKALSRFFESWEAEKASENTVLNEYAEELMTGAGIVFLTPTGYAHEDPEIRSAWMKHYDSGSECGEKMRCLVTGELAEPMATHPSVMGVRGAQSSGAALVSFNAPAYCSFGHEQNFNAPVGKYASFAYTSALNYLIAARDGDGRSTCTKLVGDTTLVYWAEDAVSQYQSLFSLAVDKNSDEIGQDELNSIMNAVSEGRSVSFDRTPIDPKNRFYILGLSPNAARLSVRLFYCDSFGNILKNIRNHYERLKIQRPANDRFENIPLWRLLSETVNQNSNDKSPLPQMSGDTLRSVISDTRYPATLFQQTELRIKADRELSRARAAIIKAYLLKNTDSPREVLSVELNEKTVYQPYVLGRLFCVLENIQRRANPGINTTIKDKYFTSASATPAVVFPTLLSLAEKHLRKIDGSVYFSKQVTELTAKITESYPKHLSLYDQGIFQLGYYHQVQKTFEKKTDKTEEEK